MRGRKISAKTGATPQIRNESRGRPQNCAGPPAAGYPRRIVPLYDFHCRACGNDFEALVRPGHPPVCPSCQSEDLERQLSTFAMTTRDQTQARADVKRKKEAHTARRDTAAMDREILAHRREDH